MVDIDSKDSGLRTAPPELTEPFNRTPPGLVDRSALTEEIRPEQKGQYGFKAGLIAFVNWEGKVYVTPGTRLKLDLLEEAGFTLAKPKLEVPYADGSAKSKRWLRKTLPANEMHRTVEENQILKVEPRVLAGIIKANQEGLRELPEDFLERCVKVREKLYFYAGLCASYRGVLAFTDWNTDTWVTPYSESKRRILEEHGYVYVESMIKVPYSLDSDENRRWLVRHIHSSEWSRTEEEVERERDEHLQKIARERIEKLGLKELPDELLSCSARSDKDYSEYVGLAGAYNGVLSFTDPRSQTYVTPLTRDKVETLKVLGYQFMGSSIKIPHSLKTKEDIQWLQSHIAEEYWNAAKEEVSSEKQREDLEQAEKRQRSLGLKDLPLELLERFIKTDERQAGFAGQYFVRNDVLGFVDPAGVVYITPVSEKKIESLRQANYKPAQTGFRMPYSSGSQQDLDFIRRQLSQQELDESVREQEEEVKRRQEEELKRARAGVQVQPLPEDLLARCAKTAEQELEKIGIFCSRGGVTCFVYEDGHYYVTPTVPWKEKALREAGYQNPEELIRVPYGSGTAEDKRWLSENLPGGEIERSREENQALEKEKISGELKKRLQKLGIDEKLPQPIASRSAPTDATNLEQIGHYLEQGSVITFVGPDSRIWITPQTPQKIELLKAGHYTHATKRFIAPHVTDSPEDRAWLEENLPEGELELSRQELKREEDLNEDHLAKDLAARRGVKALAEEFIQRCADAGRVSSQYVGVYFHQGEMMFVVDPERKLYVTPSTEAKQKHLIEKSYHQQDVISPVPHATGSDQDLNWIEENLPEGELARSQAENEELERSRANVKSLKNMEKFKLTPAPENILQRSVDSRMTEPENVGRLGVYRGVLAFVLPDERVLVSWYTPQKQEALEDCGYKLEGRLPIKVPYAMPDSAQRKWLIENLPEPDEEEAISMEENAE